MTAAMTTTRKPTGWFKPLVVYQIYPSSFAESPSTSTGTGTLAGVTTKLDYLKELGVDVVWLSPIMMSPMFDMGYDISDYREIRPEFGTMRDWEVLLDGLHSRGMKLMMDLVVNHTSSHHPWFLESRSSKTNPKRDWYIWRQPVVDPVTGERREPNNWSSVFGNGGESAWEWDETTGEYYLRLFVKEQPDLNWENPEVREAVYDIMKFWLEKGCDGFRMDVINLISKTPGLPSAKITQPGAKYQPSFEFTANGPRVHEYLKEMNREVIEKYDCMTVGECPFTHDVGVLGEYSRTTNKELQHVFTFELHDLDGTSGEPMKLQPFSLVPFKAVINKYQVGLDNVGGWNSVYLGNHDQARAVSRFANDTTPELRAKGSKMLATMQMSLCGTVYVYEGDEIGMKNVPSHWGIDDLPDVATQQYWNTVLRDRQSQTGLPNPDMSDVLVDVLRKARDNARTPMQWDLTPNAGFTTGTPWMRVNEDYKEGWNVESQEKDPRSVLNYWRKMISVRKANPVLVHGKFILLDATSPTIFAYLRHWEGVKALVILSFSAEPIEWAIPDEIGGLEEKKLLIGSYGAGEEMGGKMVTMRAYEGRVYVWHKQC
ncbi:glycoside hydrolase family 13 protein [Meredithblackwellia eburnea MCA 4105]